MVGAATVVLCDKRSILPASRRMIAPHLPRKTYLAIIRYENSKKPPNIPVHCINDEQFGILLLGLAA
jgi:hypothetical protein